MYVNININIYIYIYIIYIYRILYRCVYIESLSVCEDLHKKLKRITRGKTCSLSKYQSHSLNFSKII